MGSELQFIIAPNGERLVVMPEQVFRRLSEASEMADDVAVYDEAKRRLAVCGDELAPGAVVDRILGGESPIRVWRERRGLTVAALAERAAITQPYLSQIETGKREGTLQTMKRIAEALDLSLDDLV